MSFTTNATDPLCLYCGRPIVGPMQWGSAGAYHPECCSAPAQVSPGGGLIGHREVSREEYEMRGLWIKAERERDQWRACAEGLAYELREYAKVVPSFKAREALAEFDRLRGKEGA